MTFNNPRPDEIPEALKAIHSPCATLEEALQVMADAGAGNDAREYLKGVPGRSPGWAVKTPRQASAMVVLARNRTPQETSEPQPTAPVIPTPAEVRSFADLLARGVAVASGFFAAYPADYAALKEGRAQHFDPGNVRHLGSTIPAGLGTGSPE